MNGNVFDLPLFTVNDAREPSSVIENIMHAFIEAYL
jgi:hypothetical protein